MCQNRFNRLLVDPLNPTELTRLKQFCFCFWEQRLLSELWFFEKAIRCPLKFLMHANKTISFFVFNVKSVGALFRSRKRFSRPSCSIHYITPPMHKTAVEQPTRKKRKKTLHANISNSEFRFLLSSPKQITNPALLAMATYSAHVGFSCSILYSFVCFGAQSEARYRNMR